MRKLKYKPRTKLEKKLWIGKADLKDSGEGYL